MNQTTLDEAIAARDEAIDRVEENAHAEWLAYALLTVRQLALCGGTFSTDEVWERLDADGMKADEPRAMGAVMRRAVKDGLVESTGVYVQSSRKVNHCRPVVQYRSLLNREPRVWSPFCDRGGCHGAMLRGKCRSCGKLR